MYFYQKDIYPKCIIGVSINLKRKDVTKMIGIGAAIALGGVVFKGAVKLSTDKGFSFGAKKMVRHLHEKNRGKDTKLSKFLNKLVGVSNEELATLIDQRTDEIKEAMITGTQQLDDTSEGLLEMTHQIQDMMFNYEQLGYEDREFIQSLKDTINPDTLASEIVESMEKYQGKGIKIEDITGEIGDLFSEMGWDDKFDQVQSSLYRMEEDIKEILNRTGTMADDISDIKGKLEGESLGTKKTEIADSVLTRSNVITAGGDVVNITGEGKYIGDGAVNIEGETVNYTNINAQALSREDWKDVLSNAINDIGIGADLEKDLSSINNEQNFSYSEIAMKFKEVDTLYDNFEMESDTLLRMGNALYHSGEYKKSYECYMRALKERRTAAMANMSVLFSDKNFRDRILSEVSNINAQLNLGLKELYHNNDLRNYRVVKNIHDELMKLENNILASVEGIPVEREHKPADGTI